MYIYYLISIDLQLSRLFNSHILQSLHYILRILKFTENYVIKKTYIKDINKDRDELAASSSSSSSPKNSTIKYLL